MVVKSPSRRTIEKRWVRTCGSPPGSARRIFSSPSPIGEDGVFRYRMGVDDPDGDMFFRYRLIEAPAGMKLDLADGTISWSPLPEQVGTHRVVLEVDITCGVGGWVRSC